MVAERDFILSEQDVEESSPVSYIPNEACPASEEPFADDEVEEDGADELFEHFAITVDKGQKLLRLDKYLVDRMEHCSRNRIQTAADNGNILVNGILGNTFAKVCFDGTSTHFN